jgi:hypothetical protein
MTRERPLHDQLAITECIAGGTSWFLHVKAHENGTGKRHHSGQHFEGFGGE